MNATIEVAYHDGEPVYNVIEEGEGTRKIVYTSGVKKCAEQYYNNNYK